MTRTYKNLNQIWCIVWRWHGALLYFFCWKFSVSPCLFQLLDSRQFALRGKILCGLLHLQHLASGQHGGSIDHWGFPRLWFPKHIGIVLIICRHQQTGVGPRTSSVDSVLIEDQCARFDLEGFKMTQSRKLMVYDLFCERETLPKLWIINSQVIEVIASLRRGNLAQTSDSK